MPQIRNRIVATYPIKNRPVQQKSNLKLMARLKTSAGFLWATGRRSFHVNRANPSGQAFRSKFDICMTTCRCQNKPLPINDLHGSSTVEQFHGRRTAVLAFLSVILLLFCRSSFCFSVGHPFAFLSVILLLFCRSSFAFLSVIPAGDLRSLLLVLALHQQENRSNPRIPRAAPASGQTRSWRG